MATASTPGPIAGAPVAPDEQLRRAVQANQLDERGWPTSAPFSTTGLSADVASLCALADSQARFPGCSIAIVQCRSFVDEGHQPIHEPLPNNHAHAVVPRRISQKQARRIRNKIIELVGPAQSTQP